MSFLRPGALRGCVGPAAVGTEVVSERAWRSLHGFLCASRVFSTRCEQQHLPGQEVRPHKRKGRAPEAASLSRLARAKAARKEAQIAPKR
eukprot:5030512-Pyramimonas_sp.AAC.1